jgi:hypothetical protein
MKIASLKKTTMRTEGFLSAFFLIFLVTLGLLGLGAYSLMRSESMGVANQMKLIQADFALDAGAFFGLNALIKGTFNSQTESTALSIGGASVRLDTSTTVTATGNVTVVMKVTSTILKAERQAKIEFDLGMGMRDKAIVTTGIDNGVSARNENNVVDNSKLVEQADSIPTIQEDVLKAMAVAQGHKTVGNSSGGGMHNSFYMPDGVTPYVYYVTGNLTVSGSTAISGIFIVNGDLTINGADRIKGVMYLPNETSTVMHGGGNPNENSIWGGLISHGDISGSGNHVNVRWKKEYMYFFCDNFQTYPDNLQDRLTRWIYT